MAEIDQNRQNVSQKLVPGFLQTAFVERLIYYILIPDLCARLVFETILNYPANVLIQQKLWIFFGLIAIEYLVQVRRVLYSYFYFDKSMYAAGFLLILMLHGLLLGIGWGNSPAKVATDTIPLFVGAMNIFLSCGPTAYKNLNFARVEKINIIFAVVMLTVGLIAVRAGRPSIVSLGGAESTTVSLSIIAVSFWRRKVFGLKFLAANLAILVVPAPFLNRTTLAFIIIAASVVFFKNIVKSPLKLYISILFMVSAAISAPLLIQPDSPLGRRIEGLNSDNLQQQEAAGVGSIGDRDEEWAMIQKKINDRGQIAKIFGLGHGAVYDIVIDGVSSTTYSNAHYGWALFDLRYGYLGFVYLFIYVGLILANVVRNVSSQMNFNRVIFFICIGATLYIFTYMAFNVLIAGLQFMHQRSPGRRMTERKEVSDSPDRGKKSDRDGTD